MKKTISLIAGALLLATGAKAQVPQVLGIWELDLKSSVLPATFPLASETRSYDLRPDGYLVNLVTRKSTNGHPDFIDSVEERRQGLSAIPIGSTGQFPDRRDQDAGDLLGNRHR